MGFLSQLGMLLWKNFALRRRQKFRLVAEIVFPLALFVILVIVRTRPDLKVISPECHYDGNAMPSAGALPFLQSMVCNVNNTCRTQLTEDELPGMVNNFNQSMLTKIVEDVERILSNNVDRELIFDLIEDWATFEQLIQMIQNGSTTGNIRIGNLLLDPEGVRNRVANQSIGLTPNALNQILNASFNIQDFGTTTFNDLLQDLDVCPSVSTRNISLQNRTVQELYNRICNQNALSQILVFRDQSAYNDVQQQICNLTVNEFFEFLEDFVNQTDLNRIEQEVIQYVLLNTGREPNLRPSEIIPLVTTLYNEFRLLRSVNFQDFERPVDDLRGIASRRGMGSGDDTMTTISQFVCGQNSLLQTDSSNSNNNGFGGSGSSRSSSPMMAFGIFTSANSSNSDVCEEFSKLMNSSSATKTIWGYFKPLLKGYVTYYPNTTAINKIIEKANQTFNTIGSTIKLARDWMNVSSNVYTFLNTDPVIDFLRNFTGSCLCEIAENYVRMRMSNSNITSRMNRTFNTNMSICDFLHGYLRNGPNMTGYDWRDSLNYTNMFAEFVENFGQCIEFNKFRGYATEKEFMDESVKQSAKNLLWAALEFENIDTQKSDLPSFISYKIRMDSSRVDNTKKIMDKYWRPGPRARPAIDTKYITFGFAYLQDMIDHAIIKLHTGILDNIGVYLQQFPYPCYLNDRFIYAISRTLPLFFNLAWVLTVSLLCKSIVHEKERRLKEVMKIMGLGNLVHWMAWFINAFVMMLITIILLTIILKGGKVLEHSNPGVLLLFFICFAIATIMQCFLISVFFSRANIAACCAGFIYFILYLPYTFAVQWEDYMTTGHKVLACLSSSVAFGFGCSYIANYEEGGDGIQFSNLGVSPLVDDNFNMGGCMLMMLVDAVIYGLFTWYIEAVFPGQYGIPRKWYFPFQKSYWCSGSQENSGHTSFYKINESTLELQGDKANFEEEPKDQRLGVAIRNLKKVYKEGNKVAVNGLTINFYESQITSFLGHNGAGKTTTMSILTGLFPPTEGTAFIYGYDIRNNMDQVRNSLGMCPQYNVLFDHLTVEEHLWFYARLKGLPQERVNREVEQMIKDVGLPHKRKQLSSSLSGGMKRKLSVAMAFVGNAKTVILDEPTAGVDPYARRAIWDLLLKFKKGRTIILSTHHMDEADVLGDRIAIISHGKLRCCGSSLFLKSHYGNGYYLTLVRSNNDDDDDEMDSMFSPENSVPQGSRTSLRKVKEAETTENDDEGFGESKTDSSKSSDSDSDQPPTPPPEGATMLPGFSDKRIEAFLNKFVKGAVLVEDNTTEITFELPTEACHDGSFVKLFRELERCHKDLGISSFGISDTSLEEVFLKVAEDTGVDEPTDEFKRNKLEEVTDWWKVC
ncbi:hypothetical protein KUTeg_016890 [Tegillarca granosa]|uniref:ABC transporter domain-containing protein n=1 Tax=Tegillarca granosa TaxID=220873 RepID=A0ABQ9ESH0_TEGGR|nr:hypothetical protein KUTeg_016890 [Tegillarca granosa]